MIVYASTKTEFRQDVLNNQIEARILEAYQHHLGHSTSQSEIDSWKNSMQYMSNALEDSGIPNDTGVAIEYKIPQTSKRIQGARVRSCVLPNSWRIVKKQDLTL